MSEIKSPYPVIRHELPLTFSHDDRVVDTLRELFREADRKRQAKKDLRFKIGVWILLAGFLCVFWYGVARAIDMGGLW